MKQTLLAAFLACLALPAAAQSPATLRPYSLAVDQGTKTATAVAGAATLSKNAGVVTTEALSTAAGATYTLTLTNTQVAAADQVFASVSYGTATAGTPEIAMVKPGAGNVVITVYNDGATALNGTLRIAFLTIKN